MALEIALFLHRAAALPPDKSPKTIHLSTVTSPRESVIIHILPDGCYNQALYSLRYTSTPSPRVTVTDFNPPRLFDPKTKQAKVAYKAGYLGTVTLTPAEVTRLDDLFCFYRKKHKGHCTRTDALMVALVVGGRKQISEQFRDDTCSEQTLEDASPQDLQHLGISDAPTLSLQRIIDRALEAKTKHLPSIAYATPSRKDTTAYQTIQDNIRTEQAKARAIKKAQAIPGYPVLETEFTLSEVIDGGVFPYTNDLFLKMNARNPRLIDRAEWGDPQTNGHVL